jgi:hypothetical protein
VRFQGEGLLGIRFTPGQEVEFRVDQRCFRHYTAAAFDSLLGEVDVVFYLHGDGPGAGREPSIPARVPVSWVREIAFVSATRRSTYSWATRRPSDSSHTSKPPRRPLA